MHQPLSRGGVAALLCGALAAQAAGSTEPHPPANPDATIELPRPVTWFQSPAFGNGLDWYVAPGTYRAVLEDDKGVYYAGPSPCAWASNATPDPAKRIGQAWLCGILMPKSRQEEPRVMVVRAGFWLQQAFLPGGAPDRTKIGEAKNGAPEAGTPAILAIKGARISNEDIAKVAAGQGLANAAGGAVLAGSAGAIAGGLGALISVAIIGAIENAKRGTFEDIRHAPPAGWYKASGAVWHRSGAPAAQPESPGAVADAASAPAPAPAAVTAAPVAGPAAAVADTPAESTTAGRKVSERPANARPLSAAELEGHVWRFAHPSNPAQFGEVRISFRDGQAAARNARGGSSGPFSVVDDKLCIRFETNNWGSPCYYLLDGGSDGPGPTVLVVANGRTRPLTVE